MDVKTAGRTVDLFEVFANAQRPLTLSEIARSLDAPQSSCFNLVRALQARGFLYSVGGKKRLYPTRKLFDMASAIASYEPLIPRMQPVLDRIRDATQETTILGAQQGDRVIYLAVSEGEQTIRYISRAGELKPMHASAIGKALLTTMPAAERKRLVERLALPGVTPNTITTAEELLAEVEISETRRYTISRGENVADVMAVAVPFRMEGLPYAIAVAGPIGRMDAAYKQHAAVTRDAIADIA